jgi:hypothetical protein
VLASCEEKFVIYALLVYETEDDFGHRDADESESIYISAWRAYYNDAVDAGIYAGGHPLETPSAATTVRNGNGRRLVQDGPYANTKEQLGGLVLLDLPTLDEALSWAARCPAAALGAVEVRPLALDIFQRITRDDLAR